MNQSAPTLPPKPQELRAVAKFEGNVQAAGEAHARLCNLRAIVPRPTEQEATR